ncbi:MAG: CBS domain-containing protein [Alphaproteobacteria bacterium]|nr:CBS domain-containing protein [Alphaproteobacteria bacterium]
MHLTQVMSSNVQLANPDMSICDAAAMMQSGDIGSLPVGDNDRLVGVITDRDIAVRAVAAGKDPRTTKVRDVMSEGVRWIYDDASTKEAAQLMSKHQIRRLPVINHEKRLVGIVSIGDFAVESSEIRPAAEALTGVSKGAEKHHRA